MLPQLGILTYGIKLKTTMLAVTFLISSTNGVSGLDMANAPLQAPQITLTSPIAADRLDVVRDKALWDYLRAGINYVEVSGEEVPVDFVHPGGVAYGPLALTRIAVKDVIIHCEAMSDYTIDEVLSDDVLYEQCGKLYADLLLRHYLKIKSSGISEEEIFDILQRAWFLGPTIFRNGGEIPRARANNAREYIAGAKADQLI